MAYNDPDTLLHRAECHRQLAHGISDRRTRALLLEQATEYEFRARELKRGPGSKMGHPPHLASTGDPLGRP
jgi:hypothetical protein